MQYTETTNHATVAHIIVEALKSVLGNQDKFEKVLLLLTDSAAYMHKMASGMSALLPNCLHVTCLVHGLHRIAETVRTLFKDIDLLIANAKKVFRKAPNRISMFKEKNPDLPLPPQPCLTRWGTWLAAALYYADHFEEIKATVDVLDAGDAEAIGITQDLLKRSQLRADLVFIKGHFADLPPTIVQLQSRAIKAPAAWSIFVRAVQPLYDLPQEKLRKKLDDVLRRNSGLLKLLPILKQLDPTCNSLTMNLHDAPELPPAALAAFVYAPLTTVDVERSFSQYKAVLRSNRTNFTEGNLRKYMVVLCNAK